MKYQADLLRMVMSDRFNIARYLGMRLLDWKDVSAAFECFSRGEPIKLVLDPNGMCRQLLQQQQQPGRPGEWAWFDPNESASAMMMQGNRDNDSSMMGSMGRRGM
jgi:hypothetical protein